METISRSTFFLRLTGMSILFEALFLLIALMLSGNQLSWIELFSNLFLTSLVSVALLFGSMLFGSRTFQRPKTFSFTFSPLKLDSSQPALMALWLSTVLTFFASMLLALMFMN